MWLETFDSIDRNVFGGPPLGVSISPDLHGSWWLNYPWEPLNIKLHILDMLALKRNVPKRYFGIVRLLLVQYLKNRNFKFWCIVNERQELQMF